jgi:DNA-binding response OmpR family regulator
MTCARCAKLQDRVEELTAALGILDDATTEILRQRFKLRPVEANILTRLYAAAGRVVQLWALEQALVAQDPLGNAVRVHVSRLRKALGADHIETVHSGGYRLSPVGRARVYQALNPKRVAA